MKQERIILIHGKRGDVMSLSALRQSEIVFFGKPLPENVCHVIRSVFGVPPAYAIGIMILSTTMFLLKYFHYRLP